MMRVHDNVATECMKNKKIAWNVFSFILTSLYPRGQIICSRSV